MVFHQHKVCLLGHQAWNEGTDLMFLIFQYKQEVITKTNYFDLQENEVCSQLPCNFLRDSGTQWIRPLDGPCWFLFASYYSLDQNFLLFNPDILMIGY